MIQSKIINRITQGEEEDMRKKLLAVLLSGAMAAATLTGCGSSADAPADNAEQPAEEAGAEEETGTEEEAEVPAQSADSIVSAPKIGRAHV